LNYKKIAYVDFFEPLDWYIVSALYVDEMREPARRLFHREIFITLAALLIACVITFFIVRRFTKPVKNPYSTRPAAYGKQFLVQLIRQS